MPVSHIGLTVSHLPTSCSFFLSALQPLGYRFIGQQGNQIGLGINDADFFICQETPGVKAGAAHIAFSAPTRTAVRDFYTAALNAGGRPNGSPACRNEETGYFNAAVMDFDGNSIEVVYREDGQDQDGRSVVGQSRVLTWQKNVAESQRDDRSVISGVSQRSMTQRALTAAPASVAPSTVVPASVAPSQKTPSAVSKVASMVRSVSDPVAVTQATRSIQQAAQTIQQTTTSSSGEDTAKKIIGTLLGAAAGAAVAYAMCKGEEDSVKVEKEFNAFQTSQREQPRLALQDPQPIYESPPKSVHRNISDTESHYSTPRQAYTQRAIEAAPARSYHSPTYASVPPTQAPEAQYEYVAASAVGGPRSQYAANRSVSSPSAVQYSPAKSRAPSSFISSLHQSEVIQGGGAIPSEIMRAVAPSDYRSSAESVHSQHTTKSHAKSSHTSAGKSHSPSKAPSAAPSAGPAGSIVGSVLGRDNASESGRIIDIDAETVAPSDSISQIGSSRRSHASAASIARSSATKHTEKHSEKRSEVHSSVSRHSSATKHTSASKHSSAHSSASKHSKHSSASRHSHKSSRTSSRHGSDEENIVRPSAMSEASDASTIKPSKRKDSVVGTGGTNGQGGWGTVVSLPVRGITPSMVEENTGAKKRSVVSYAN